MVAVGGLGNARGRRVAMFLSTFFAHISDLHGSGEVGCAKLWGYCNTVSSWVPPVPPTCWGKPAVLSHRLPPSATCPFHSLAKPRPAHVWCAGLAQPTPAQPHRTGLQHCVPLLREQGKG